MTGAPAIKYFNGMYDVIIIRTLSEDSVLCRALYPTRDHMPREDFITEKSGVTDVCRIANVHRL
jgi:hypothetical protein